MANGAQPGLGRERIEHVIVLMMENRSFDHMLGYLNHNDRDYPNLERLRPSCPVDPDRPDGDRIPTSATASARLGTDPDHSHEAIMLQMYGRRGTPGVGEPRMNGFIRSYRLKIEQGTIRTTNWLTRVLDTVLRALSGLWSWIRRWLPAVPPGAAEPADIMRCFAETDVPVLSRLAKDFAVLAHWHASVPGETWPNRNFAHAATSDGTANNEIRFYGNPTVFERLGEAGQQWAVYHDGLAQVWAFPRLWDFDGGTERFHDAEELFTHIRDDRLPAYTFVEPDHGYGEGEGNSQHPGNNTVTGESFVAGEVLMARIYNALVANPSIFEKTLFLITYDEHGGFFDHVPPAPVTSPDGEVSIHGFDFGVTGVRVPAVAISPLIAKGWVDYTDYDHSSIPATVRRQFAPDTDHLTARDKVANDLLARLPLLPAPRTDCAPIEVPRYGDARRREVTGRAQPRTLNEFQASLLELASGMRVRIERTARPRAATEVTPEPFERDPALLAAAQSRALTPGSEASRAVDEVVAHFTGRSGSRR